MITTYLLQTHLDPNGWQNPLNEIQWHLDWQGEEIGKAEALLITLSVWLKSTIEGVEADDVAIGQVKALEDILEQVHIQKAKIERILKELSVRQIEFHHESQAEKRFGEKTDTAKGQGAYEIQYHRSDA